MKITDVIQLAKNGKLKNMPSIANNTDTIVGFINTGLIELYKRFPLKTNEYMLALKDGVTIYTMPSDLMWIVAAYQEVSEPSTMTVSLIPINEEDNPESLNTISWNQVQVPVTITGAYISIIYVAAPPFIYSTDVGFAYRDVDNVEQEITDIPIPAQMVSALLDYIAYEANDTLPNTGEVENKSFYNKFETSCQRIEQRGMFTPDDLDMKARHMKGFV